MNRLSLALVAALAVWALSACGGEDPVTPVFDVGPGKDTPEPDEGQQDADAGDASDAPGDVDPDGADQGEVDTGPPPECGDDPATECAELLTLGPCEQAGCDDGQCVADRIPLCCEQPSDCVDLTLGPCDQAACQDGTCVAVDAGIPGCCTSDLDCADTPESCCETGVCNLGLNTCTVETLNECCTTDAECDDGLPSTEDVCEATCQVNGCAHKAPLCDINEVYTSKNFDNGTVQNLQLAADDPNGVVKWQVDGELNVSPPFSLRLGRADCPSYYNGPMTNCVPNDPFWSDSTNLEISFTTGDLVLNPEAGAYLSFWVRMSAEAAGAQFDYDYLAVRVVEAGKSPVEIWRSTDDSALGAANNTGGEWRFQAVNLNSYAGKNIRVRFIFSADNGSNYAPTDGGAPFEGVWLDDIRVRSTCDKEFCDAAAPTCFADGNGCTDDGCSFYANGGGGVCAYQAAVVGAECQSCDEPSDCGNDPCVQYACTNNVCSSAPKDECCDVNSVFPELTELGETSTEDFEFGIEGWTVEDPYPDDNVTWQLNQVVSLSGAFSLYFGDSATLTYDALDSNGDSQPAQATIWSPPFDLGDAEDLRKPVAGFWLWMSTEYDESGSPVGEGYDSLRVLVREPGGEATEAWSSIDTIGNTTKGQWVQIGVDLTAWSGMTVELGFDFDSGDPPGFGISNDHGGVRIDDFDVTRICGLNPCLGSLECDDGDACTFDVCALGTCENTKDDPLCCDGDDDCVNSNACTTGLCVDEQCEYTYNEGSIDNCCSEGPWAGGWSTSFPNLNGWTVETDSDPVTWWHRNDVGASDNTSVNFSNPATKKFNKPGGGPSSGRLISPPILVPPYASGRSYASFSYLLETEWDTTLAEFFPLFVIDELRVKVMVDGVLSDDEIWVSHYVENSTLGAWFQTKADLSAYTGMEVQLVFEFDSGDQSNNPFKGPFIDDVSFGTTCKDESEIECVYGGDCNAAPLFCDLDACTEDFTCDLTLKALPQCCEPAPEPTLTQAFEAPVEGWEFTTCEPAAAIADPQSVWQFATAQTSPIDPQDGFGLLYFGNGTDYGGSQGFGACGQALSPVVTLEPEVPWTLSYWIFADIEPTPECDPEGLATEFSDILQIGILDMESGLAEPAFFTKAAKLSCNNYNQWVQREVNLDDWAGKEIRIWMSFDTGDPFANEGKGIGIDTVEFVKGCADLLP